MRPCAQIREIPLLIKGNLRILRKILDQLHLIRLALLFHKSNGFLSGKGETLQLLTLLDDFLHLSFQLIQILPGKRLVLKIIIKAGINTWPDSKLGFREHMLHRLSKHMGSRMADHSQPFLIPCRQDRQLAIPVKHRAQILHLPVHQPRAGRPCQTLADISRNLNNTFALRIFLYGTVF